MKEVSRKDISILQGLRIDARASLKSLSKVSSTPIATTYTHLQKLKENNIFQCTTLIDPSFIRFSDHLCYIFSSKGKLDTQLIDMLQQQNYEINDIFNVVEKNSKSLLLIFAFCKGINNEKSLRKRLQKEGTILKTLVIKKQIKKRRGDYTKIIKDITEPFRKSQVCIVSLEKKSFLHQRQAMIAVLQNPLEILLVFPDYFHGKAKLRGET